MDKFDLEVRPGRSFVYIIKCGETDFHKIGLTNDPFKRFKTLQANNPHKLHLVGISPTVLTHQDARRVEDFCHANLKAHRVRSEWFEIGTRAAAELLAAAISECLEQGPRT